MLLKALEDAEDVGEPERATVERHQDLGTTMADDGIAEIVQPMVL
eukprot:CAMPEP_0198500028 /NCGR_PEP_ID=MMETSP1462-20131121/7957_1 /TAXON_ID=1333877 /ORGANISM="Brandtodinium nutriculum, Strain RCC3387" /LENGTH=44 /DNA_ID= /DNA_START= /DNA_END= /DNA_ORIENTATION=